MASEDRPHRVTVHVTHVNDVKKVSFEETIAATLQDVWTEAYAKLEIPKDPKDVFQTAGKQPKSLMPYLSLTLQQAHEQKVIDNYQFEIVKETGGA